MVTVQKFMISWKIEKTVEILDIISTLEKSDSVATCCRAWCVDTRRKVTVTPKNRRLYLDQTPNTWA